MADISINVGINVLTLIFYQMVYMVWKIFAHFYTMELHSVK